MSALQQTGNLSRVYTASCHMVAGIGSLKRISGRECMDAEMLLY